MNEINWIRLYIAFRFIIIIILEYLFWRNNFPYFDVLSLLNLFCFEWGISTTFVDLVQIHNMWRTIFKKKRLINIVNYKYNLLSIFFHSH